MTRPTPILRELAGRSALAGRDAADVWRHYLGSDDLPWHILRSEGFRGSGVAGLFQLYEEMEEKDGHLFAVLQTRKNGVLSCPRKVVPASENPRDQEIARFVEQSLHRIRGFDATLMNILDALGKGLSIQEIVWEERQGRIEARELKSRAPARFAFGPDESLRLAAETVALVSTSADAPRTSGQGPWTDPRPLPERKFVVFVFGGLYQNPYGLGLCARAYWYYWFKKNNLKFWVIYNEKFGSPTILGKYRPGATDEDRQRLYEVIESLQNDTGVTVPESITIELLEARRTGNASTYRDLADWCNDEISKIVLGATLTSSEGRRSGSRSLGEVHERVRSEYIEADARALEDAVNSQLVRWLVDFNFGPDVDIPRWTIDTADLAELAREIDLDRQLVAAGIALPESYFYSKYGRPAPVGREAALRYDDQNLFQYHLRYGLMTVNEARERLGMPPVAWGDARVGGPFDDEEADTDSAGSTGRDDPAAVETSIEKEPDAPEGEPRGR
ncbi:DUF935 family protein [Candidatus Sumerlaeota bacterium]|nr:DUF935 family protein [Candidatus Sumerlaeota bacterium]